MPRLNLLRELTLRELSARYRGSVLGAAWAVGTPLLMLAVYALVFGEILSVRWPQATHSSSGEFAVVMFAGLLVFNFFAECVSRAPALITGNVNYVKKVVFPVELLPVAAVLAAIVQMLLSVAILLVFEILLIGRVPPTVLLLPVVILPVCLFCLGAAWLLASLGVYLRDVQQLVGVLLGGLIFLTPIFYPAEMIPAKWRIFLDLNPLTIPVNHVRDVLVFGRIPAIAEWSVALVAGALVAVVGYAWFARTRSGMADVL